MYNIQLDPTCKRAIRAHGTVEEMLDYAALSEQLTAISSAFESEAAKEDQDGETMAMQGLARPMRQAN